MTLIEKLWMMEQRANIKFYKIEQTFTETLAILREVYRDKA